MSSEETRCIGCDQITGHVTKLTFQPPSPLRRGLLDSPYPLVTGSVFLVTTSQPETHGAQPGSPYQQKSTPVTQEIPKVLQPQHE